MNKNNLINNVENQVSKIYSTYRDQIDYINDTDSANQLMILENRKINNYLDGVIEEVKLDLLREISKANGIEVGNQFSEHNFRLIEIKPYELRTVDIYEEVAVRQNKNIKQKEAENNNVNGAIIGGLTLVGGIIGGTTSNAINDSVGTGAIIGAVVGLGLGIFCSGLNKTSHPVAKSNSKCKEEKKLKFSPKKMLNIIDKREIEAKRIIKENILQIISKYDEICRGL